MRGARSARSASSDSAALRIRSRSTLSRGCRIINRMPQPPPELPPPGNPPALSERLYSRACGKTSGPMERMGTASTIATAALSARIKAESGRRICANTRQRSDQRRGVGAHPVAPRAVKAADVPSSPPGLATASAPKSIASSQADGRSEVDTPARHHHPPPPPRRRQSPGRSRRARSRRNRLTRPSGHWRGAESPCAPCQTHTRRRGRA